MRGGLGNIMQQAQELQEKMREAQEQLATLEVTGESGGGMVSVVMTCRHDVKRVTIDDSLMGDEREVLEDLVAAAMNDAVRKAEKATQEKMSGLTAGLNIPGFQMPM